jgi:hypothetical protein
MTVCITILLSNYIQNIDNKSFVVFLGFNSVGLKLSYSVLKTICIKYDFWR